MADLCEVCGKPFQKSRSDQTCCWSPECRKQKDKIRMQRHRAQVEKNAKQRGAGKEEVRHCSNCGAVMGSGHIKFGKECRSKAGAPAYVETRQEYKFMEACGG